MLRKTLAFAIPWMVTGCTGLSLGEKTAGSDTYLEYGDIAVDDRTEKSFLLTNIADEKGNEAKSLLRAVDPDSGAVSEVTDLTDRDDARILFPASGILVMSEQNEVDELRLLDKDTFAEKQREELTVRYHGTRMSPTRKWVAVADNTSDRAPIHIIDSEILARRVIPHNGEWLEAMWLNKTDELFAIVFYNSASTDPLDPPRARILSWSMEDVAAGKFEVGKDGFWPDRKVDIELSHMVPSSGLDFTWIGVSPDDKWVVFPVESKDVGAKEDHHALLVVETATGDVRIVTDAQGPVGFTPDSSTIVSYDDNGSANGKDGVTPDGEVDQRLLLIDVNTLEIDPQDVDISGPISFFISRDGNYVVTASNLGDETLVLYDVDNDTTSQMAGRPLGLFEFVSRKGKNELWLLEDYSLFKLDMNKGDLSLVKTDYSIDHLNILPKHDWLVTSEVGSAAESAPRVHFFDPETQTTVKTIDMP